MITLPKLRPSITQVESLLSQPSPNPKQVEMELKRIGPKINELTILVDKLFSQIPSNINDEFADMKNQIALAKKRGKYENEKEYIDDEAYKKKGKFNINIAAQKEEVEKDVESQLNKALLDAQQKQLEIPINKEANMYSNLEQQIGQYIFNTNAKLNELELKYSQKTLNGSKIPYWQMASEIHIKNSEVKNSIGIFDAFISEINSSIERLKKFEGMTIERSNPIDDKTPTLAEQEPRIDSMNQIIDEQNEKYEKVIFEIESKLSAYENSIKSMEEESAQILESLSNLASQTSEQRKNLNELDRLIEEVTKSMHSDSHKIQIKSTFDNYTTKIRNIETEIQDLSQKMKRISLELPL